MQVQWYPGHMHKALKEIREILPEIDIFVEILDARIPYSSQNPSLAEIRGDRPCLRILNKSDLADASSTTAWMQHFSTEANIRSVAICREDRSGISNLIPICQSMVIKPRHAGYLAVLVSGIPNVGKSTLINAMTGRAIAKTGNEPAITKGLQRIKLDDNCWLYDTPGVLWPNIEHPASGYRLAMSGAVRDTAMDYPDVAHYAAAWLLENSSDILVQRYGLEQAPPDASSLLQAVGRARGALRSGGRVDEERAAKAFIADIRDGSLGRLTLESPTDAQREMLELEEIREKKAARKAARKSKKGSKQRKSREHTIDE